jgi:hypothetical protein
MVPKIYGGNKFGHPVTNIEKNHFKVQKKEALYSHTGVSY